MARNETGATPLGEIQMEIKKIVTKNEFQDIIKTFNKGNWSINYAIRNLTTMDEEQTRLWDDQNNWLEAWGETITEKELKELTKLMANLENAKDLEKRERRINEILLPYINNKKLYDENYSVWESLLFLTDSEMTYENWKSDYLY